ncbi:hypothetical protein F4604DRAFT_1932611 [Suillus subluteus]|nr:hypothetical protein F4604DRAFT_1932611 [Suillus subluteus]
MADHDTIKLELPAQLKTFKFTFECRRPGPLTVEISMQRSLKQSKSQPSTSESPDTGETQTERPEILTHWLQAQETRQVFLAKIQDLTQKPNKRSVNPFAVAPALVSSLYGTYTNILPRSNAG